jgi:hypothetical protein
LSLLGALFGLSSKKNLWRLGLSVVFFVLALFTKHTMIAAPLACFIALYAEERRTACIGAVLTVSAGAIILLLLEVLTSGGFLAHLIRYNLNRFTLGSLPFFLSILRYHVVILSLSAIWLITTAGMKLKNYVQLKNSASVCPSMEKSNTYVRFVFTYLIVTALSSAMIFKSGSNVNYLAEWMFAVSAVAGIMMYDGTRYLLEFSRNFTLRRRSPAVWPDLARCSFVAATFALMAFQAGSTSPQRFLFAGKDDRWQREYSSLQARVSQAARPLISDDMVLILKAKKQVYLEPAIISELSSLGRFDEAPILKLLDQHYFEYVVTERRLGTDVLNARYSAAMRHSIADNYPTTSYSADYAIHSP